MKPEIRKRMQIADYPNRHWQSLANSLINSIRLRANSRELRSRKLKNLTKYFSAFHRINRRKFPVKHSLKFTLAEGGTDGYAMMQENPHPWSGALKVKYRGAVNQTRESFRRANGNAESFAVTRGSFVSAAQIVNHGQLLNVICNLTTRQRFRYRSFASIVTASAN